MVSGAKALFSQTFVQVNFLPNLVSAIDGTMQKREHVGHWIETVPWIRWGGKGDGLFTHSQCGSCFLSDGTDPFHLPYIPSECDLIVKEWGRVDWEQAICCSHKNRGTDDWGG